jgi:hypothetical protein
VSGVPHSRQKFIVESFSNLQFGHCFTLQSTSQTIYHISYTEKNR